MKNGIRITKYPNNNTINHSNNHSNSLIFNKFKRIFSKKGIGIEKMRIFAPENRRESRRAMRRKHLYGSTPFCKGACSTICVSSMLFFVCIIATHWELKEAQEKNETHISERENNIEN